MHAEDTVAAAHGGQAVRDDDHRAALDDLAHVVLDDALAFVVQRAGRLVQDQDARPGRQGAGDGDALTLPAGQVGAALLDGRVVALRQPGNELVRAG